MSDIENARRIIDRIIDPFGFYPERLGSPHEIYNVVYPLPMVCSFIDCVRSSPSWTRIDSLTFTESLFILLRPLVDKYDACWSYITVPDGAYTKLHWHQCFDERFWGPMRLWIFEIIPAEQCGPQHLVLTLGSEIGVIVFSRLNGLNISYYGNEDLWNEISRALFCRVS